MRRWWLSAPWWVYALTSTTVFATAIAAGQVLHHGRGGSLVGAVVGGVAYGGITGPRLAKNRDRLLYAVGPLPGGREGEVWRAAGRGPVPRDRDVRDAALRLLDHRLHELSRARAYSVVLLSALALLCVLFAATRSWWALLPGAVLVLLAVDVGVLRRRRLERRSDLLFRPPGQVVGAEGIEPPTTRLT